MTSNQVKFNGDHTAFPPFKRTVENLLLSDHINRLIFNKERFFEGLEYDPKFLSDKEMTALMGDPDENKATGKDEAREAAKEEPRTKFGSAVRKRQELVNNLAKQLYLVITACCDDTVINKLDNRGVPRGDGIKAWRELCKLYTVNSPRMQLSAFIKLIGIQQSQNLSAPNEYIHEFRRLRELLDSTGLRLPETILKHIVVAGLSSHFGTVTEVMQHSPDLTLKQVIIRILSYAEDHPVPTNARRRSQQMGLLGGDRSGRERTFHGDDRSRREQRTFQCYNCGGDHHEKKCQRPCRLCVWDGQDEQAKTHTRYNCPEKKKLVEEQKAAGVKFSDIFTVRPRRKRSYAHAAAQEEKSHEAPDDQEWGLMGVDEPVTPKTPPTPPHDPPLTPQPIDISDGEPIDIEVDILSTSPITPASPSPSPHFSRQARHNGGKARARKHSSKPRRFQRVVKRCKISPRN